VREWNGPGYALSERAPRHRRAVRTEHGTPALFGAGVVDGTPSAVSDGARFVLVQASPTRCSREGKLRSTSSLQPAWST
jgi:hypothetical protein